MVDQRHGAEGGAVAGEGLGQAGRAPRSTSASASASSTCTACILARVRRPRGHRGLVVAERDVASSTSAATTTRRGAARSRRWRPSESKAAAMSAAYSSSSSSPPSQSRRRRSGHGVRGQRRRADAARRRAARRGRSGSGAGRRARVQHAALGTAVIGSGGVGAGRAASVDRLRAGRGTSPREADDETCWGRTAVALRPVRRHAVRRTSETSTARAGRSAAAPRPGGGLRRRRLLRGRALRPRGRADPCACGGARSAARRPRDGRGPCAAGRGTVSSSVGERGLEALGEDVDVGHRVAVGVEAEVDAAVVGGEADATPPGPWRAARPGRRRA